MKTASIDGPSLKDALSNGRFWALALGVPAGAIPLHMVLIHQVAAVSDAGFSKELAVFGLGLIGLFTAPAMIFMGLLADRIGRQWSYLLGSASLMVGIFVLMMITDASRNWLFYAFPPFIAFGFSVPAIALSDDCGRPVSRQVLRRHHRASALFIGAGAGIGPWLGGMIHDWTGNYFWAFSVPQALTLTSVVFIWIAGSRSSQ